MKILAGNEMLLMAIGVAVNCHHDQVDKSGNLYILHPLHVMDTVDGIDAKTVAVLHDTIEDTSLYLSDLEDMGFPEHILQALDAITKRRGEKLEEYWTRIKENQLATQVKLADIAHNSLEERLAKLSREESDYLRSKYERARKFILQEMEYEC